MSLLNQYCLDNICNQLNNDRLSLFSLVLVNRRWCQSAIPFLWENPFNTKKENVLKSIIDVYSRFIPEVNTGKNLKCPLFQYPEYLRKVDMSLVTQGIDIWLGENGIPETTKIIDAFKTIVMTSCLHEITACEGMLLGSFLLEHKIWKGLTSLELESIDLQKTPLVNIFTYFPNLDSLKLCVCTSPATSDWQNIEICNLRSLLIFDTTIDMMDLCFIFEKAKAKLESFSIIFMARLGILTSPINFQNLFHNIGKQLQNLENLTTNLNPEDFESLNHALQQLSKLKALNIGYSNTLGDLRPLGMGKYLKDFGGSIPNTMHILNVMANWEFTPEQLAQFFDTCGLKLNYVYFRLCTAEHLKIIHKFRMDRVKMGKKINIIVKDST